jgi:hypothetical protein
MALMIIMLTSAKSQKYTAINASIIDEESECESLESYLHSYCQR